MAATDPGLIRSRELQRRSDQLVEPRDANPTSTGPRNPTGHLFFGRSRKNELNQQAISNEAKQAGSKLSIKRGTSTPRILSRNKSVTPPALRKPIPLLHHVMGIKNMKDTTEIRRHEPEASNPIQMDCNRLPAHVNANKPPKASVSRLDNEPSLSTSMQAALENLPNNAASSRDSLLLTATNLKPQRSLNYETSSYSSLISTNSPLRKECWRCEKPFLDFAIPLRDPATPHDCFTCNSRLHRYCFPAKLKADDLPSKFICENCVKKGRTKKYMSKSRTSDLQQSKDTFLVNAGKPLTDSEIVPSAIAPEPHLGLNSTLDRDAFSPEELPRRHNLDYVATTAMLITEEPQDIGEEMGSDLLTLETDFHTASLTAKHMQEVQILHDLPSLTRHHALKSELSVDLMPLESRCENEIDKPLERVRGFDRGKSPPRGPRADRENLERSSAQTQVSELSLLPTFRRQTDRYRPEYHAPKVSIGNRDNYSLTPRNSPSTATEPQRHEEIDPQLHEDLKALCKRLTCRFWKMGACIRGEEDCYYAHQDTSAYWADGKTMNKRWTCYTWKKNGKCHYGNECIHAHHDTKLYVGPDNRGSDKHVTCFFIANNKPCSKTEETCKYSHRYTGLVAGDPTRPIGLTGDSSQIFNGVSCPTHSGTIEPLKWKPPPMRVYRQELLLSSLPAALPTSDGSRSNIGVLAENSSAQFSSVVQDQQREKIIGEPERAPDFAKRTGRPPGTVKPTADPRRRKSSASFSRRDHLERDPSALASTFLTSPENVHKKRSCKGEGCAKIIFGTNPFCRQCQLNLPSQSPIQPSDNKLPENLSPGPGLDLPMVDSDMTFSSGRPAIQKGFHQVGQVTPATFRAAKRALPDIDDMFIPSKKPKTLPTLPLPRRVSRPNNRLPSHDQGKAMGDIPHSICEVHAGPPNNTATAIPAQQPIIRSSPSAQTLRNGGRDLQDWIDLERRGEEAEKEAAKLKEENRKFALKEAEMEAKLALKEAEMEAKLALKVAEMEVTMARNLAVEKAESEAQTEQRGTNFEGLTTDPKPSRTKDANNRPPSVSDDSSNKIGPNLARPQNQPRKKNRSRESATQLSGSSVPPSHEDSKGAAPDESEPDHILLTKRSKDRSNSYRDNESDSDDITVQNLTKRRTNSVQSHDKGRDTRKGSNSTPKHPKPTRDNQSLSAASPTAHASGPSSSDWGKFFDRSRRSSKPSKFQAGVGVKSFACDACRKKHIKCPHGPQQSQPKINGQVSLRKDALSSSHLSLRTPPITQQSTQTKLLTKEPSTIVKDIGLTDAHTVAPVTERSRRLGSESRRTDIVNRLDHHLSNSKARFAAARKDGVMKQKTVVPASSTLYSNVKSPTITGNKATAKLIPETQIEEDEDDSDVGNYTGLVRSKVLNREAHATAIAQMKMKGVEFYSDESDREDPMDHWQPLWMRDPAKIYEPIDPPRLPPEYGDPRMFPERGGSSDPNFDLEAKIQEIKARPTRKSRLAPRLLNAKTHRLGPSEEQPDWRNRKKKFGSLHRECDRGPSTVKGTTVREVPNADRMVKIINLEQEVETEKVEVTMEEFLGLPAERSYCLIGSERLMKARTLAFRDATAARGRGRFPDKEKWPIGRNNG